jgi:hypothetical protein
MNIDQLKTLLGSLATLILLPLLIDWIKRRMDYGASVNKARFDILSDLNTLIWNYHAVTGRLYQLSVFMEIAPTSDEELKEVTKRFTDASDALYAGLYSCRSRIHQYFNDFAEVDLALDDLRDWTFHGGDCPDNCYLMILHNLVEKHKYQADLFRSKLDGFNGTMVFRDKAEQILQPLARQLRETSSFWYPLRQWFRRKSPAQS